MNIAFLQNLHSGVRWLIVLVGLIALARHAIGLFGKQAYDSIGRISLSALTGLVTIQFLLGLTLIIWKGTTISTAAYWGLAGGHAVVMIIAIAATAATSGRVKRAATDAQKWRIGTIGMLIVAALVFIGVAAVGGW